MYIGSAYVHTSVVNSKHISTRMQLRVLDTHMLKEAGQPKFQFTTTIECG